MKLKTTLLFLIIAGFLPLILAGSCRFYTDKDGNCVSKCVYPQIGNADTKTCLTDDSYCTQFFIQTYNVCSSQCPKGYAIKSAQGKKYQYCIPCQFQDENGKCYETCPFDMITDYTTQKCLSSPSQCQAYFIRDQQACISVCPPTYIVDNTQTPKLCVNCYASGACATNNDGNQKPSNDNNNNNNGIAGAINNTSCNLYLAANMYDCLPQCPQQQIALPQVQGQSYVQCQLCPPSLPYVSNDGSTCVSQCNTGEVLLMYNCMSSVSQCKFNVYTDDNKNQWCVKNCPPNLIPVQVKDQQYSICQSCPADKFFDPQLIQCVDTCPIQDATGKFCLPSIKSCNGYVSIDQKKCLANCPSDQYAENGQNFNQFQCVAECQKGHFILTENKDNIVYKYCVETCPFFQFAVNNQCSSINQCTNYLSMDGLTCLTSCPAGQFPQLLPTQKLLTCLPCMQKLSSDGKSCNDSCAADELYDVQLRQCQNSSQCTGIKQDGMCLTQCQLGYVLSMDSAIKTCVPISSCASYVSSDRQSCVKTCGTNEGIMPLNNQLFCVICPLGLDTDGISCKSKCPSSQIFDIASLSCKDINKCTGILSANGQRCVSECQFPEVKPSPQATQCAYKCESGQLLQENGVCIDPTVNPYCLSCPTGLTTVDAKTSGGRFRNLQSQSGQTYQLTYNVNPSQITKTICVSYDSNNVMTVNPTSINIAQNQITCTFTNNSSLYYDSNCQYISKKLCSSQKSSFNDQVSTNSNLLSISLAFVMIFVIYI
ncbi:zinc finger, LSD1 subclass family protein, putative (macronuclear) [Tetrahymena thermophila SB210]|uniref:Zinc finger, LSD1 subclass family protein, putative n=1 Tax=Tetrahymena thermophila (strain SB210) TaxID=312017 RepID=Q22RC6_TETTS|nr:zinc finger, LSD1 subclass family protein, putative [Tetrahymena thermophila SB210]EAR88196.3 zinc finger, LSD1 subclass family protein, putative [Tetrahymena thermophila SB210]|eukprot:XP_001008441.3 zinc finger, LSD1 subclass family protein, putative [Tetrahymena thermophila SB210]